jgi:hypothetical protein
MLAKVLLQFDPAVTFPELLNGLVFAAAPGAWAMLQRQTLVDIRSMLPSSPIYLSRQS